MVTENLSGRYFRFGFWTGADGTEDVCSSCRIYISIIALSKSGFVFNVTTGYPFRIGT
jgi:hypothetical protein